MPRVWCNRATVSASRWNAPHRFWIGHDAESQHPERDHTAERSLLGLVDDTHPATAQLTDDPELAQGRR